MYSWFIQTRRRHGRLLVISLIMVLISCFSRCLHGVGFNDPRGGQYAGAAACINCHRDISGSYMHSNHYRTSAVTDHDHLKKLMGSSGDRFYFADSSYIHIAERGNAFFQSYFVNGKEDITRKFDIAFGSGEKAQTYGYWKENQLYQLPLTYFTSGKTWANSPGFPASHARFGRVIESRCFECHASYIDKELEQTGTLAVSENLDKSSIIYGIDCERCHGPALQHVKFQQENPSVKTAKYIVPIRSLSRQRQLDVCGVCHAGNDQSTQRSVFGFLPGDTLSNFYYPDFGMGNGEPDVHGKQLQLLETSKCFIKSGMTCTTCHDVHEPEGNKMGVFQEGNKMAVFVSKCMDCHQQSVHAATVIKENEQRKRDFNLVDLNCIDCHMPLQTSKTIYFDNGGGLKNISYMLRTHKIAIYK